MSDEPYGPDALKAWEGAMELVKAHKFDEARSTKLYRSDYIALEKMIAREQAKLLEATANANKASVRTCPPTP